MGFHKRHLKNLLINALGRFMNIYADIVGLNEFAIKQPAKQFQCTFDLVTLLVFEKTMVFCYQNCSVRKNVLVIEKNVYSDRYSYSEV